MAARNRNMDTMTTEHTACLEMAVAGVAWCADVEAAGRWLWWERETSKPVSGGVEIRTDHVLIDSLSPLASRPESAAAFEAMAAYIGRIMTGTDVQTELQHLRYLCESVAKVAGQNTQGGASSPRFS